MKNEGIIKYYLSVVIGIGIVCGVCSSGFALNSSEAFSQFQFNFITPGARATALGGAFIGLADDATAVEANPAGLTALTVPEISLELKRIIYTTEQVYENLSHETEIIREEFEDTVRSVPFASVVYPYNRIAFSLYRQEQVNYKSSYRTGSERIAVPGTDIYFAPRDAAIEITVVNYGIGVAVQLLEGLSVAVSPRWSQMKMKSQRTRFGLQTSPDEPTNFLESDVWTKGVIDDEDFGYGVNAGIIWKPHSKISLGAVYKNGAAFSVKETYFNRETGYVFVGDRAEFTVKVPESYGAGITFRATDFLSLTLDVVHIRYEDLLEDFDIFTTRYARENFTVDNATEIHAGVEYLLVIGERLLALRAGFYTDPDHTIRFTDTTGDPADDRVGKEQFPGGDDQIHITGGVGLVLNEHFQIDTAVNIAEKHEQLSLSVVYRF